MMFRFLARIIATLHDALAFPLGLPTFWERNESAEALDIAMHGTRELRFENLELIKQVDGLRSEVETLLKRDSTHRKQIADLEHALAVERDAGQKLKNELNEILNFS
jgi:hypothetical protein